MTVEVRALRAAGGDALGSIVHAVVARGDTCMLDPATPRDEALAYWLAPDDAR